MRVFVETDVCHVEVSDAHLTYSPDVMQDLLNRLVPAAMRLTEQFSVPDDGDD